MSEMKPVQNLVNKTLEQTFSQKKISGVDVLVWLLRHLGWFGVFAGMLAFSGNIIWKVYMKPEVRNVARSLDAPIIQSVKTLSKKVDDNKIQGKKTYYLVKKMELVQKRTAPQRIVKEAEEEIEIEKLKED